MSLLLSETPPSFHHLQHEIQPRCTSFISLIVWLLFNDSTCCQIVLVWRSEGELAIPSVNSTPLRLQWSLFEKPVLELLLWVIQAFQTETIKTKLSAEGNNWFKMWVFISPVLLFLLVVITCYKFDLMFLKRQGKQNGKRQSLLGRSSVKERDTQRGWRWQGHLPSLQTVVIKDRGLWGKEGPCEQHEERQSWETGQQVQGLNRSLV